jgi:hypothetical protein
MERWTPKPGSLTLDDLAPSDHPLFRFIFTRNGHNVALYGGRAPAEAGLRDRSARFPADDWSIIDRNNQAAFEARYGMENEATA